MTAYYNDNDPFACRWLKRLIAHGEITKGKVDGRSITNVEPGDYAGFTRCHWFAGIAGWEEALRIAGWPANEPVWSASLPCQPFSCAGKQKGLEDERNLWPAFYRLVCESRPPTIIGEQVPDAIGHGWLDRVFDDLEALSYTCGAIVLPACGAGAPILRHWIFWVVRAVRSTGQRNTRSVSRAQAEISSERDADGCVADGFGNAGADCGGMERSESHGRDQRRAEPGGRGAAERCGDGAPGLGHADSPGLERRGLLTGERSGELSFGSSGFWSDHSLVWCRDPKHPDDPTKLIPRRVEPSSFPLASGIPAKVGPLVSRLESMGHSPEVARRIIKLAKRNRIGRLRGYGNSISPEIAAVFVRAVMDVALIGKLQGEQKVNEVDKKVMNLSGGRGILCLRSRGVEQ